MCHGDARAIMWLRSGRYLDWSVRVTDSLVMLGAVSSALVVICIAQHEIGSFCCDDNDGGNET